jgi:signal transduction histidine kinase
MPSLATNALKLKRLLMIICLAFFLLTIINGYGIQQKVRVMIAINKSADAPTEETLPAAFRPSADRDSDEAASRIPAGTGQPSGRKLSSRWYAIPAALFLLGVSSIIVLVWTSVIHERQRANFAFVDTLKELRIKTAAAHLWLEESLTEKGDANRAMAGANLTDAMKLSETILYGGESEYGSTLQPRRSPELLEQAEKVRALLSEFGAIAKQRHAQPDSSGPGSNLDERFDDVFKDIEGAAGTLEDMAEKKLVSDYAKMTRLFLSVVLTWSLIVVAATAGLWSRESRRKRAEEELQNAKDQLEAKVAERTRELENAYDQLSRELAERKQVEKALRETEREAERQAHLASLGELAAGVAHEINNPVNGIINCAEILVNKTGEGSRERDLGKRIIKEGGRIAYIVKGLLSFAREEAEEKVPVPVREILADTLALVEAQMKKEGITLRVDIDNHAMMVRCQPQRIEQVFLNIINNARDALNQKYPMKVEGKTLGIAAKRAERDGRPHVRIAFHDRGTGVPANVMNRIMDPFFSTKPKGKGTGLGLSISHGIVENHGGKLLIESVEGEFTEAVVELPVV